MSLIEQVLDLAFRPRAELPVTALQMARLSLQDWVVCGLAGIEEPLAGKLRAFALAEGGQPVASVFGGGAVPARMAALVNGATSHALDFDDTHFAHIGHLSVGIYPAALAAGEAVDASLEDVVEAFLIGAEAAIRIGIALGAVHYNRGFHQTATAGAFGATLAAGRLYGLDRQQMRAAIGLCATRASGLKSQFGTMGKPYNAGIAAANGIEAASLAALGMTSADDGLDGAQGFLPTHSDAPEPVAARQQTDRFLFQDNKYKFHACCHGLHAMIEALNAVASQVGDPAGITAVEIRTNPRWLRVCNNPAPRTGLEVKFSYAWLAGMVLHGIPTGDDRVYTDGLAGDARLTRFASRVQVGGDAALTDAQVGGAVLLADGRRLDLAHDLMQPLPLAVLDTRLADKAGALLGARGAAVTAALAQQGLPARALGALLREGAHD